MSSELKVKYADCPHCGIPMQCSLINNKRVDTCMKCGYSKRTNVLFATGGDIDLSGVKDGWSSNSATTNGGTLQKVKIESSNEFNCPSPLQVQPLSAEETRMLIHKAEAYDRIMSGGSKSVQEWANILQKPVAYNSSGTLLWFDEIPEHYDNFWYQQSILGLGVDYGNRIPDDKMEGEDLKYWKTSLRLPMKEKQ